jgi:hypothetical protein
VDVPDEDHSYDSADGAQVARSDEADFVDAACALDCGWAHGATGAGFCTCTRSGERSF